MVDELASRWLDLESWYLEDLWRGSYSWQMFRKAFKIVADAVGKYKGHWHFIFYI